MEKTCPGCKNKFDTNTTQKFYCSVKCREKHRGELKNCKFCGKEFLGRYTRIFCSAQCFGHSNKQHLIDRNLRNRKYPNIEGLTRSQVFWRYNPEKRKYHQNLEYEKRVFLINCLGGKCVHCGYNKNLRALVLDHIFSDGKQDRKRVGSRIYRYYYKNIEEAKEKLQVLCSNCNMIKSFEKDEYNSSRRIEHKS